jgi:hypothetical protein
MIRLSPLICRTLARAERDVFSACHSRNTVRAGSCFDGTTAAHTALQYQKLTRAHTSVIWKLFCFAFAKMPHYGINSSALIGFR